jgi:hypothetical protein
MAENNWVLQDGRSILVEFEAAASATAWGWFGNRSSGEGLEFSTAAVAWTDHAWLRGGQYIMPAGAGSPTNYVLSCTVGTFNLTGNNANLLKGYRLVNSVGTFNFTGNNINLLAHRRLINTVGTFNLTGNAANLVRAYRLPISVGAFNLTGNNVNLLKGYRLITGSAAFNLTGNDATLIYGGGSPPILSSLSEIYRRRRRL